MMRHANQPVISGALIALAFSFGCSTDDKEDRPAKSEGDVKGKTLRANGPARKLDARSLAPDESATNTPDEKDQPTKSEAKASEPQQRSRLGYLYHRGKKYPLDDLFGEGKKDLMADEFIRELDVNRLVAEEEAQRTLTSDKGAQREPKVIYAGVR